MLLALHPHVRACMNHNHELNLRHYLTISTYQYHYHNLYYLPLYDEVKMSRSKSDRNPCLSNLTSPVRPYKQIDLNNY